MIAVLGGSFDPIHLGHLNLAQSLLAAYDFEKIYFVPAKQNPLKNETTAPPDARLHMVRLALEELGEPRFEALDWEITSEQPSYTALTLERLISTTRKPAALLMGNEVFETLDRWYRPAVVARLACLVVVRREGSVACDTMAILAAIGIRDAVSDRKNPERVWHAKRARWIDQRPFKALPYSATALRAAIGALWAQAAEPVAMPQGIQRSVWQYIKENRPLCR